jgi:hypothetical protein
MQFVYLVSTHLREIYQVHITVTPPTRRDYEVLYCDVFVQPSKRKQLLQAGNTPQEKTHLRVSSLMPKLVTKFPRYLRPGYSIAKISRGGE